MSTSLYSLPLAEAGLRKPITKCSGFAKKKLADWKIDLMFLCFYGCDYCSSNYGNNMRFRGPDVAATLGIDPRFDFATTSIAYEPNDFINQLLVQLQYIPCDFGKGETLVMSMLTDAFSPPVRNSGLTRKVFDIILQRTAFRIRILTKWTIGLDREWVEYLSENRNRVVVGMSCGTLDDSLAAAVEHLTPKPSQRVKAFHTLLNHGVPCYAMFCPILPGAHKADEVNRLIDAFVPSNELVETVWAEPFNDRRTAGKVLSSLKAASHRWSEDFGRIFASPGAKAAWSAYATDLLLTLRDRAAAEGWIRKLNYLLYEASIVPEDAARIGTLDGVLLQSVHDDGFSKNPDFRIMQDVHGALQ